MKITWYGHAAFKIVTGKGVRIIIDPYQSGAFGGSLAYDKIADEADIVLTTHDHDDHNYTADIRGPFTKLDKPGEYEINGVRLRAVPVYHDASRGSQRGRNLIFVIEVDGLALAHLGDLGHTLDQETLKRVGKIDILLIPVGGFFTIDPGQATAVMESINPSLTIPMHYKTEKCAFPIAPVAEFTSGKSTIKNIDASETEITKASLPAKPTILVLRYAR